MEFHVKKIAEEQLASGTRYTITLKADDEKDENHTLKFVFWDSYPGWARELGLDKVGYDDLIDVPADALKNFKQLHVND